MTAVSAAAFFRAGRDSTAVRVVAVLRVAALLSVAGIGSFVAASHGRVAHLLLLIGLIGVPWSTIVFFCADRPDNRIALYGGPLGDLLLLFAVQSVLDGAVEPVLPGYLVLVAFTVYTVGRSFATLIVTGAIALTLVAHQIGPGTQHLHTSITLPLFVGVIALLFLLDRTTALQEQATAASERLRGRADKILDHVADAVFVTDGAGRMVVCNPAAERLIGMPSAGMVGTPCNEVLGLFRGERAIDCSAGCGLLRTPAANGHELWREDLTGRRQPLLAEAAEVPGTDGRTEVVHSMRDITRLKQAEEAKTLFLATASHELKTPLTVISGFASTLLRFPDIDDKMRASALDAIWTRSQELTRIVERLLLSSRIEAGRLELELVTLDISSLLRDRVASSAAGINRRISFIADDEDVPRVIGNPEALTTVIDHLIDNAVKYSPNGEPVEVAVTAGGKSVQVSVADKGIGMDADQLAHCFDRFWQAESTDVRRFGGTGIGLYIVQSLVDAMGGTITVDSTPGEGSTFTVQLRMEGAVPEQPKRTTDRAGEATSIREFMRQIGVPERTRQ